MANEPEIKVGDDGELEYEYDITSDDFKPKRKPPPQWRRNLHLPLYLVLPLALIALVGAVLLLINTNREFFCTAGSACISATEYVRYRQQFAPAPPLNEVRVFNQHMVDAITGETISDLSYTAVPAAYPALMCDTSPEAAQRTGRLMFTMGTGDNAEIFIVDENGDNLCRLTNNLIEENMVAWSPDGTRLAFVSQRSTDEYNDIYVMNFDGTNIINLTNDRATNDNPVWSRDSTQIAYSSDKDGTGTNIFVVNNDGIGRRNLTHRIQGAAFEYDQRPSWSPYGIIAFISNLGFNPGTAEIYTVDPTLGASSVERISHNLVDEIDVSWSPDGHSLLFRSVIIDNEGVHLGTDLFVMDATGQNRRRITNDMSDKQRPIWSPDGARIAFVWDGSLYTMNSDGSEVQELTEGVGNNSAPQWR